jgi:hypothetical protein
VVRTAIELGVEIEELPAKERGALLPELQGVDLTKELSVDAILARRKTMGGTAPERVSAEAKEWEKRLAQAAIAAPTANLSSTETRSKTPSPSKDPGEAKGASDAKNAGSAKGASSARGSK